MTNKAGISKDVRQISGQDMEQILGPATSRYFGSGFRTVQHTATVVSTTSEGPMQYIEARGSATYPPRWSLDASGRVRAVHLSGLDAVALTSRALSASGMDGLLQGARLSRVRVRAPAATTTTTRGLTVSLVVDPIAPASDRTWHVQARVGGFRVSVELEEQDTSSGALSRELGPLDSVASSISSVVESLELPLGPLAVNHAVTPATPLSSIEELALLGQLSQVLVYASKGVDRSVVPNLWLRWLDLSRAPHPSTPRFQSRTTLTRDRTIRSGDVTIHDLRLRAELGYGARAEAGFGYQA